MCIPMIYAHWEGFVVSALRALIRYLNGLELMPEKCPLNLVVMGLGSTYQALSGKQSFDQRIIFTEKFQKHLSERIKFDLKIDTKSNLNADILKELCQKFGFRYEYFKDIGRDINSLVNIRNAIAHGENSILPDEGNVENLIEIAQKGMDLFLQEINYFLENKKYFQ